MKRQLDEPEAGFDAEQLGGTMHSAFWQAMAGKGPNDQSLARWAELDESMQVVWMHLGRTVQDIMDSLEGNPFDVNMVAQQLYEHYAKATGHGDILVAWEALPPRQRWAWQAVFRHVCNCLSFEDPSAEDMEAHELFWRSWVNKKMGVNDENNSSSSPAGTNRPVV